MFENWSWLAIVIYLEVLFSSLGISLVLKGFGGGRWK